MVEEVKDLEEIKDLEGIKDLADICKLVFLLFCSFINILYSNVFVYDA